MRLFLVQGTALHTNSHTAFEQSYSTSRQTERQTGKPTNQDKYITCMVEVNIDPMSPTTSIQAFKCYAMHIEITKNKW